MHKTCINASLLCLPLFVFVFFIFSHCMVCPCSKYCFWLPICDILKLLLNILYSSTCVQNEDYLNLFPVRQLRFGSHVFFQWQWGAGQMYQIPHHPTPTPILDKDYRTKSSTSWNNDTIVLHFCILIFHILFFVMFIYKLQIKKHRSN